MAINDNSKVVPGWKGGFAESNPAFAYPNPDLSSLQMLCNMQNIDLLQRQQKAEWPEFSWETEKGNHDSRCYQMFAPDISRIGYTDTGRVYSIICPQQGIFHPMIGCLNIEVTVTGQRGWVNENNQTLAADMTIEGKVWFSPTADQYPVVKKMWEIFEKNSHRFPMDKGRAIRVTAHEPGNLNQPIFHVRDGLSPAFKNPDFALHNGAWAKYNVEVEIGTIIKTGDHIVDAFNALVMNIFNLGSGNLLQPGNVLSWNIWASEPSLVDTAEWANHAKKWRDSIDTGHGSPDGPGTTARYFDGTPFNPLIAELEEEIKKIITWIENQV